MGRVESQRGRSRLALMFELALAGLALAAIALYVSLPPRTQELSPDEELVRETRRAVSGAFHVHTVRSDGTGSVDEVALAAARSGLNFVVLTDHGDATRQPEPPTFRHGVLMIDAVEISTRDGHYIALDLPAAPYPLAGEGRDVAEDVRRLGGFGVIAHPHSPKAELSWRDWDVKYDGLEWINVDSEWRDERWWQLPPLFFHLLLRPPETLASLLDRPADTLDHWDARLANQATVALAGHDAHARIGLRPAGDPYSGRVMVKLPSYETVFRTFAIHVELDEPLSANAPAAAKAIMTSIRAGRVFTAITALAEPAPFQFFAKSGEQHVTMGERLLTGGPIELEARVAAPAGSRIMLYRNGELVHDTAPPRLEYLVTPERAAYRVEVHLPGAPGSTQVPWIVSNPIYVNVPDATREKDHVQELPEPDFWGPAPADPPARRVTGWEVEQNSGPTSQLEELTDPLSLRLDYALGDGPALSFVGVAAKAPADLTFDDALTFEASADRPMRCSVQIRVLDGGSAGIRWTRSVYVGREPRTISVRFDDMRAVSPFTPTRPDLPNAQSILFVVDTTNLPPGSRGSLTIKDPRVVRTTNEK